MIRRAGFILAALVGLAACEPVPKDGLNPQAAQVFAGKTPDQIMPRVSGGTLVSAFKTVCDNNVGNPRASLAAIKANGLIGVVTQDGITVYADPNGKFPMTALGRDPRSRLNICMVLVPDSQSLRRAAHSYLGGKPGVVEVPVDGRIPGALKLWGAGNAVYLTIKETNPVYGDSLAVMLTYE